MESTSWQKIKDYYGNRCAYCGTNSKFLTKDHLLPKAKGGDTTPENIAPACNKCNQKKANLPIWEML